MEMKNKHAWLNGQNIIVALIGVVLIYLLVTALVNVRFQQIEQGTRLLIADQQKTLIAIAETTARNGADTVTESIVRDCSVNERSEFDDLLGKLDSGLSQSQLSTLERLFGRCGPFFSERKSVMVARLSREIEIYESYVSLLGKVTGEDLSFAFDVPKWQALAAEEKKQSELFAGLVSAQDEIISTLLSGSRPDSSEIKTVLQKAREIQETLIVANKQTATIRAELVSL